MIINFGKTKIVVDGENCINLWLAAFTVPAQLFMFFVDTPRPYLWGDFVIHGTMGAIQAAALISMAYDIYQESVRYKLATTRLAQ